MIYRYLSSDVNADVFVALVSGTKGELEVLVNLLLLSLAR